MGYTLNITYFKIVIFCVERPNFRLWFATHWCTFERRRDIRPGRPDDWANSQRRSQHNVQASSLKLQNVDICCGRWSYASFKPALGLHCKGPPPPRCKYIDPSRAEPISPWLQYFRIASDTCLVEQRCDSQSRPDLQIITNNPQSVRGVCVGWYVRRAFNCSSDIDFAALHNMAVAAT